MNTANNFFATDASKQTFVAAIRTTRFVNSHHICTFSLVHMRRISLVFLVVSMRFLAVFMYRPLMSSSPLRVRRKPSRVNGVPSTGAAALCCCGHRRTRSVTSVGGMTASLLEPLISEISKEGSSRGVRRNLCWWRRISAARLLELEIWSSIRWRKNAPSFFSVDLFTEVI